MDSIIAVDLGGTNVRAALFPDGGVRAQRRVERPSHAAESVRECVEAIVGAVEEVADGADPSPKRIGMAVPGHIVGKVVHWAPNFGDPVDGEWRCWRDIPLGEMLESRLGLSIVMGNDANLAALGEYWYGAGKGRAAGLAMITLGTGIGTGIVLSPECVQGGLSRPTLLIGGNGGGAELGHLVIVRDGQTHPSATDGTVEAYCGTHGILVRARTLFPSSGPLFDLCKGDEDALSPKVLFDAAEMGDATAQEVWRETGGYLGVLFGNIINAFAPEVIAIGGQISKAWKYMEDGAMWEVKKTAIPSLVDDTRIVIAELQEDAGLSGALVLARESES